MPWANRLVWLPLSKNPLLSFASDEGRLLLFLSVALHQSLRKPDTASVISCYQFLKQQRPTTQIEVEKTRSDQR